MKDPDSESHQNAVEIKGLTKVFGSRSVLKGIDLEIPEGQSVVIFGPNGAGKTTLIKILATIINPTAGEIIIDGYNIKKNSEDVRRKIGIVTHQTYLYGSLTVSENLDFYSRMYDVPRKKDRINEVLDMVGMSRRITDRVGNLSRGMQQRVSIARALLHKPGIILLDEPGTGLDQQAGAMLNEALRNERQLRRTIVQTTHSMDSVTENCDRTLIIAEGKIAYEQTGSDVDVNELIQAYRYYTEAKV